MIFVSHRWNMHRVGILSALTLLITIGTGCAHHRTSASRPTAPPAATAPAESAPVETGKAPSSRIPPTPAPAGGVSAENLDYVAPPPPTPPQDGDVPRHNG